MVKSAPQDDPAADNQDPVDLDNTLYNKPGFLVRLLHQASTAIFADECSAFGITPVQYGSLAAIRANPGIDQIGVAIAIGFDRTTIGGVIERLEAKKLLVRKVSAEDRRSRSLHLTPAGERMILSMKDATERVQVRLLAHLEAADQDEFLRLLRQLVRGHFDISDAPLRLTRKGSEKLTRFRAAAVSQTGK